jgi:glucose/arabinose dehydrogenase
MQKPSFAVCGLVVSFVLSVSVAVGHTPVSAATNATCSKKNVGKVVAGRVCVLKKRRYVWVERPVPTTLPSTVPSTLAPSTPTSAAASAESAPGTQRLKGPRGAFALDVPASWTVSTEIQGTVLVRDSQTGAELWLGVFPQRVKFSQAVADNPKLMKSEYGVNLVKSESGSYAGSVIQTMWYSEPGSTKEIVVRIYERELSVGGFLIAEITVKNTETEALLLGSLDRMEVKWRPA